MNNDNTQRPYAADGADGYDGVNVYDEDGGELIAQYPYERTSDEDAEFVDRAKTEVLADYPDVEWAADGIVG